MKRLLGFVIVAALAVTAVYLSVNKVWLFTTAQEEAASVPDAATAAPAEVVQPTVEPTLPPPPTSVPPSPVPPTAVILLTQEPPTPIPPTATLEPTLVPPTEIIIPTEAPTAELAVAAAVLPTDALPTQADAGILPTATIETEATATTDVAPTVDTATDAGAPTEIVATSIVVPSGVLNAAAPDPRGRGSASDAVNSGGQLSTGNAMPPATQPVILPTATIQEIQATVAAPATVEMTPTLMAVPSLAPSPAASPAAALAQISGIVNAPVSANLVLTLPDNTTITATTSADGSFVFADLQPGTYRLEASADGFLTSRLDFTLADGQSFAAPPATLRAGDTNGDNVIDVRDAVMVAANFGGPATSPAADPNRDGIVDIRDLTIIGSVFGQSGPVTWGP